VSEAGERGLGVVGKCEVGDGDEVVIVAVVVVVVVVETVKLLMSRGERLVSEAARCRPCASQDTMACAVPPHAPEILRSPPPDLCAFVCA
jgi:hypothetical protein